MIELLLAGLAVAVYDGDTVRLPNVPQSFRVVGLDTPEIRGKCEVEKIKARQARDRLRELIKHPTAKLTEVLCYGSNWGRKCGVITVNGQNVALTMVAENLADPYYCGSKGCPKRRNWCQTTPQPP
jgi:endonuclease YncB( thermonuclease family)